MPAVSKPKQILEELVNKRVRTPADDRDELIVLQFPPDLESVAARYLGAAALAELTDAAEEKDKSVLLEACFRQWVDHLWQGKACPPNFKYHISDEGRRDMEVAFIVMDDCTLKLSKPALGADREEDAILQIAQALTRGGCEAAEAEASAARLVNNEIDFTPRPYIDIAKYVYGRYEGEGKGRVWVQPSRKESQAALKCLQLLKCRTQKALAEAEPITDAEMELLLEVTDNKGTVAKGFCHRALQYATTPEQLWEVLHVVSPKKLFRGAGFALSDTLEEKNHRLLQEAISIVGIRLNDEAKAALGL